MTIDTFGCVVFVSVTISSFHTSVTIMYVLILKLDFGILSLTLCKYTFYCLFWICVTLVDYRLWYRHCCWTHGWFFNWLTVILFVTSGSKIILKKKKNQCINYNNDFLKSWVGEPKFNA